MKTKPKEKTKPTRLTEVPPVLHLVGPGKLIRLKTLVEFQVSRGETAAIQFDPVSAEQICLYGNVITDSQTLGRFADCRVSLAFLSAGGRKCFGRFSGHQRGKSSRRLRQWQTIQNRDRELAIAKKIVSSKLDAITKALRRYQQSGTPTCKSITRDTHRAAKRIASANSIEQLRGIEGNLSKSWFAWMS